MSDAQQASSKLNRRAFLAASAAGAAVAASAGAAIAAPTRGLVGTSLGKGWTITDTEPGFAGALRIGVTNDPLNREVHILVCKSEGTKNAMATTGKVDFFLLNDGKEGQVRTPKSDEEAVQELAKSLHGRESQLPGFSKLMGQRERLHHFDPIDHANPVDGRI
jgi:hypothetical protein